MQFGIFGGSDPGIVFRPLQIHKSLLFGREVKIVQNRNISCRTDGFSCFSDYAPDHN
jgi:hypothetical protein